MRNRLPDHYRTPIILLLMIIVGIFWYIDTLISDWTFDRAFTSLIILRQDNVSEIRVFDGESSKERLLVKKSSPKDNEVISEFVRAINKAEPIEKQFPFRQLILSQELYLVIDLKDSRKPIELAFYSHTDCGETVYIDFVGKPGGAKSEIYLYDWLKRLGIWNSLGCD
jgi:hypothetical protein